MDRALAIPSSRKSRDWVGVLLDFGGVLIDKMVRRIPSGNGSQHAVLITAIESFWRCTFAELWPFLCLMGVPGGPRGVLAASPGGPRGVPGGSQGRPRGPQGRAQGMPGILGDFGDVLGIPGILSMKMTLSYDSVI